LNEIQLPLPFGGRVGEGGSPLNPPRGKFQLYKIIKIVKRISRRLKCFSNINLLVKKKAFDFLSKACKFEK
jgi:hypothetical protein